MKTDVCVVIPTIEPRRKMLYEALASVDAQTHRPAQVVIAYDDAHEGAPATRNRASLGSQATWTANCDDDDLFMPDHLAHLLWCAEENDADLISSWFMVEGGGRDPFPQHRGLVWDPAVPRIFPIGWMVRTEILHQAIADMGGYQPDPDGTGNWMTQDFPLLRYMIETLGAKHHASPEVTYRWRHWGGNTSGVPTRWK